MEGLQVRLTVVFYREFNYKSSRLVSCRTVELGREDRNDIRISVADTYCSIFWTGNRFDTFTFFRLTFMYGDGTVDFFFYFVGSSGILISNIIHDLDTEMCWILLSRIK